MEGGYVMGYMLNPSEFKPTDRKDIYTPYTELYI